MRPPCESVVREFLPKIRAYVVKILVEEQGLSITEAAKLLNFSTVSASKYRRIISQPSTLEEEVLRNIADGIASVIRKEMGNPERVIQAICDFCRDLRASGGLCLLHRHHFSDLNYCSVCLRNSYWRVTKISEREKVLENLSEAFKILASIPSFIHLVPEVRTNIAMALKGARTIYDVAAFPGRITVVNNRLFAASKPAFGASRFLSRILLNTLKVDSSKRGIICIKYSKGVEEALRRLKLKISYVKQGGNNVAKLSSVFKEDYIPDVIADLGGYGVEPVIYLFAEDAVKAAQLVSNILDII